MAEFTEKILKYTLKDIYGSDGIFSLIVSDYIYNNITNNNVRDLIDFTKINVCITYYNQPSTNLISLLSGLGVQYTLHRSNPLPSSGNVSYRFYFNSAKGVRQQINSGPSAYYTPSSRLFDSNTEYNTSPNCIVGAVNWGGTYSISLELMICDDSMVNSKTVYIYIRSNGAISYTIYDTPSNFNALNYFNDIKPIITPEPDPYSPGGHSGGGGGTGRFSRTGDTIGEHNVPTLSAVDAGFITLFAPTAGEMKALASYLWSDLFSIDTFKKIFANPMDAILGLSIVPVSVPTAGSASVKVGNISTGVSMTKASTQYVKLSCGSLDVEEYWGAYLDYSPYTKCEIYLPYIGVHELSIDDVMGKTVKVVYYIDILSGACTAEIYSNGTCLYSFAGQCSASIPITGNDWTNVINGVMQIGASIGSMVASGGLTAPISGAGVASGLKSVASASTTVASSKPNVERSGSMSGAGGMLGQQTPYLIITWPKECIPADQNKYIGYPSFVTVNLGKIVGFNTIESVHLENIPATSAELDEIESLLMNGVIF